MTEQDERLRESIFRFLFDMPRGASFAIKTVDQMRWIKEFIQLHGYEESVELNSTNTRVKKHKFLTKDYKKNLLKPRKK